MSTKDSCFADSTFVVYSGTLHTERLYCKRTPRVSIVSTGRLSVKKKLALTIIDDQEWTTLYSLGLIAALSAVELMTSNNTAC